MKRILVICILLFNLSIYSQYTQSIPFQNFIGNNNGGGNLTLTISTSGSISLAFNCGFGATSIQNKYIDTINYTGTLPDMVLGTIVSNGITTSYKVVIVSKKLYLLSSSNESIVTPINTLTASTTSYTPVPTSNLTSLNTLSENFVREINYLSAQGDSGSKQINTTFYDGLGRPKQQVLNGQSTTGKNIVINVEYDAYGRQVKEYLPYRSTSSSLEIESGTLANTLSFYGSPTLSTTGDANFEATQNPYSEKLFEASPLNRILEQAAPGSDWALNNTVKHTIRIDYQFNTVADAVKKFKATTSWNVTTGLYEPTLTSNLTYGANMLYKTITKNENWISGTDNTTEEYKDKEGKVVLKRTFDGGDAHDTYYVYDVYGNLTYVLTPKANIYFSTTELNNLCYQYKYDFKNRLVEKKMPGKQWEYIIYDRLDRVVANGPVLSPFSDVSGSGWMITKYDRFNRVVYTGWQQATTIDTAARQSLQATQNALITALSEVKQSAGAIDSVSAYYSNDVEPKIFDLLAVNYYDDYTFPNAPTSFSTVLANASQAVFYNNSTAKPKGSPTGSWVRTSSNRITKSYEKNYVLYDYKLRTVRTHADNYLGGYTEIDSKLDFIGNIQYTETKHKRVIGDTEIFIKDSYTYNPYNLKMVTHIQKIGAKADELICKNSYSELGTLIEKRVGDTNVTTFTGLQKVDYSYNIRGWLKGINDVSDLKASTENDLFAFKLNYNTVVDTSPDYTGTPLYNGNISETYWRSKSDNVKRKYSYEYDSLNRLKNAVYQKPDNAISVTNSYNETLEYDKNGNITALQRTGAFDDAAMNFQIDNLNYFYGSGNASNLLMKVTDSSNDPSGFKDDSNG